MEKLWALISSTRFKLGAVNIAVLVICEIYKQATGNEISLDTKVLITTTILGLIGVDSYRKMGEPSKRSDEVVR